MSSKTIRWLVRGFPVLVGILLISALCLAVLVRVERTVEAPGEVRVEEYAVVRPEVSGLVTTVAVEPGDRIRHGQVLLRLQDFDFDSALRSARRQLEEDRARLAELRRTLRLRREVIHPLEIAKRRHEVEGSRWEAERMASQEAEAALEVEAAQDRLARTERLWKEGLVSESEVSTARRAVAIAEEQLEQARLQADLAQAAPQEQADELSLLRGGQKRELLELEAEVERLATAVKRGEQELETLLERRERHVVRANLDGVVIGIEPQRLLGRYVEAGQELFRVIDDSSIFFVTRVPEQAVVRVVEGLSAQVEIAGLPKREFRLFRGHVQHVAQAPELSEGTDGRPRYPVRVRVASPWIETGEGRFYLRSGMSGKAEIAYRRDVPMFRALYESLVGKPQLPERAQDGEYQSVSVDRPER